MTEYRGGGGGCRVRCDVCGYKYDHCDSSSTCPFCDLEKRVQKLEEELKKIKP